MADTDWKDLSEDDFEPIKSEEEWEPLGGEKALEVVPNVPSQYGEGTETTIQRIPRMVGGGFTEIRTTPGAKIIGDVETIIEEGTKEGEFNRIERKITPDIDLSKREVRTFRPDFIAKEIPLEGGRGREFRVGGGQISNVSRETKTAMVPNTYRPFQETMEETGRAIAAEQFRLVDLALNAFGKEGIGEKILSEPERAEALGSLPGLLDLVSPRGLAGLPGDILAFGGVGKAATALGIPKALARNTPTIRQGVLRVAESLGLDSNPKPFFQFVDDLGGPNMSQGKLEQVAQAAAKRGYPLEEATSADLRTLYTASKKNLKAGQLGILPDRGRVINLRPEQKLGGQQIIQMTPLQALKERAIQRYQDDTNAFKVFHKALGRKLDTSTKGRLTNPQERTKYYRGAETKADVRDIFDYPEAQKKALAAGAEPATFSRYLSLKHAIEKGTQAAEAGNKELISGKTVAQMKEELANLIETVPDKEGLLSAGKDIWKLHHSDIDMMTAPDAHSPGFFLPNEGTRMKAKNPFFVKSMLKQEPGFFGKLYGQKATSGSPGAGLKNYKVGSAALEDPLAASSIAHRAQVRAVEHNKQLFEVIGELEKVPGHEMFIKRAEKGIRPIEFSVKEIQGQLDKAGAQKTVSQNDEMLRIFRPYLKQGDKDRIIRVMVGGKPIEYELTDEGLAIGLDQALSPTPGQRLIPNSWPLKMLQAPTRIIRLGAVELNPLYLFPAAVRDVATMGIQTRNPSALKAMLNVPKALAEVLGKSKQFKAYMQEGGGYGAMIPLDSESHARNLSRLVNGKMAYARHPITTYRELVGALEKGPRLAEFKIQKKKYLSEGFSEKDANFLAIRDSQEVTVNFATAGTSGREINRYVPFFNAGIQSLAKLGEVYAKNPVQASLRVMSMVTLPSIALWDYNRGDPVYENLPEYRKRNWYHIPKKLWGVTDHEDPYFTLPRPFVHGALAGYAAEKMLDYFVDKDPQGIDKALDSILESSRVNFTPAVLSLALSAIGEQGYDLFRDRSVLSQRDIGKLPFAQSSPGTSSTIKALSGLTRGLPTPEGFWGKSVMRIIQSPKRLEHMLLTQTAGAGRAALNVLDTLGEAGGLLPSKPKSKAPTGLNDELQAKVFELWKVGEQANTTLNHFQKTEPDRVERESQSPDVQSGMAIYRSFKDRVALSRMYQDHIYYERDQGNLDVAKEYSKDLNALNRQMLLEAAEIQKQYKVNPLLIQRAIQEQQHDEELEQQNRMDNP